MIKCNFCKFWRPNQEKEYNRKWGQCTSELLKLHVTYDSKFKMPETQRDFGCVFGKWDINLERNKNLKTEE